MAPSPVPPARPRLKSADLVGSDLSASAVAQLTVEMLGRLETLENSSAKSQDVRDLSDRFGTFQEQATSRDLTILSELSGMRQAQRASSKSTTTWLRYGLSLLAAIGAVAPFLSDTLRSNPAAFGPYGAVVAAVLLAIGQVAKPTSAEVKAQASGDEPPQPPPAHS